MGSTENHEARHQKVTADIDQNDDQQGAEHAAIELIR